MLVWSGQAVSLVGSAVLRFAFIIEVWSTGEQATAVTALSLCALLPQALFSPFAGAIIDRMRKRSALQIADVIGLATIGALTLVHFFGGGLEPWQVYPATVLLGIGAAFQLPALTAAIPLLVRKDQLGRANGLLAGARSAAGICGPALGGIMVALSGIGAVLVVDLVSYAFALIGIRVVRMKGDKVPEGAGAPRTKIVAEAVEGLRYLFRQASLRDMTVNFCTVNLVMVFGFAVIQPMVLLKSGNGALAAVNSAIGVGGVVGGLLMAAWGGPRNRGRGMMLGIVGMCVSAQIGMSLVGGVAGWCVAMLIGSLLMTVVNASMQAIVQTKVPQDWQGRAFGAVMFLSQISVPLATAVSGPLADQVFEPQAADGSGVFAVLGPLLGDEPGSGMAGMLFLAGVAGLAVALWGLASRSIRHIDVLLPDIDEESGRKGGEKDDAVRA
ncbi:MFS transporter [Streptomyces silaceus]|uniref:MFS transporter n=1 Tax=Streptomyces silaceus TaxID=545123 RepID=UPI001FC8FC6C|nr:MFS transporter [Streptomyces silaceus]